MKYHPKRSVGERRSSEIHVIFHSFFSFSLAVRRFSSVVGGGTRGRARFGRSFPSTIIPENSYLSSRQPSILTIVLFESGKKQSSERFDRRRPWLYSYSRRRFFSSFSPFPPSFSKLQLSAMVQREKKEGKKEREKLVTEAKKSAAFFLRPSEQHAIVLFRFFSRFRRVVSRRKNYAALHSSRVIVGCETRNGEYPGAGRRKRKGRGVFSRDRERVRKRAAVNEAIFQFLNN